MKDNTILMAIAEAILGAALLLSLFIENPVVAAGCLGGLLGVLGGHLNGGQAGTPTEASGGPQG